MARTARFSALRRLLRAAARDNLAAGDTPPAATTPPSRRAFLAGSIASLTALSTGCLSSSRASTTTTPASRIPHRPRIAVIGAGMAGLHCAYRLAEKGLDVRLFEAGTRVGGRMFTARDSFKDKQVAELGGELIDTGHTTLHALAREFHIQLDDRFASEPPKQRRDLWFLGGRAVPDAEIVEAFRPLARVMAQAVAVAEASELAFFTLDHTTLAAWLEATGSASSPLIKALIRESYTGEYGLDLDKQSAFNLLNLIDYHQPDPFRVFGDSDERYHTHLGSDTFPSALAERLVGKISLETRLAAIAADPDGRLRVLLDRKGASEAYIADHVVVAIPFTMLRRVRLDLPLPEPKRALIDQLGYGTNAKLMMGFNEPWWRTHHDSNGSSLSDLGIQNTWETSLGQEGRSAILTQFAGGTKGMSMGESSAEYQAWMAMDSIEKIFPGARQAYSSTAVRMHWPSAPLFQGSYSCYLPGQWATHGEEGKRVGNLHFAGEHTSLDNQGFMEGAAETGGLVAAEILRDLGESLSEAGQAALAPKLLLPQSTYRAETMTGLRWIERRRVIAALTR